MDPGLTYAGRTLHGITVRDSFNCTSKQSQFGASDTTRWTGECTKKYGFAVTEGRSREFRAELDLPNGQPLWVLAFETVQDEICVCGETGESEEDIYCEEISFRFWCDFATGRV